MEPTQKPPHTTGTLHNKPLQQDVFADTIAVSPASAGNVGDDDEYLANHILRLGETLVNQGMLSPDQLDVALKEQERTGRRLGSLLVDLGFVTENVLNMALRQQDDMGKLDLSTTTLDISLIRRLPKEIALKYRMIPLSMAHGAIRVAMTDPRNVLAVDEIRRVFGHDLTVIPLFATKSVVNDAIDRSYEHDVRVPDLLREMESWKNEEDSLEADEASGPAVRLVEGILLDAIRKGASDIHFEPDEVFVRIRYRLDGVLQQFSTFHKEFWMPVCLRIKIIAGMNIAQTRTPQDGRITIHNGLRDIDMRVATHPTIYGENIVVRVLDREKSILALDSLGFSPRNIELLRDLMQRPEGIVVITGPTGSGKTTTLYSILNEINDIQKNIMTLEEPVEYQLQMIRQTEVSESDRFTFADGIRSILRQDPDIVLVGEARDEETANMALRAAMTGHQVFTTLHTNDAISALSRFYDLKVSPGILAGNLISIMAQRLARKLCTNCCTKRPATQGEYELLQIEEVMDANGCENCNGTGYRGRVCVMEILAFDAELDDLVATKANRTALKEQAIKGGFQPMLVDAIHKIRAGITTLEEIKLRIRLDKDAISASKAALKLEGDA